MSDSFTLYLATMPEDTRRAVSHGITLAHMAYKVGPNLTVNRGHIGMDMRGGLMVLSHTSSSELHDGNILALCKEAVSECHVRGYEGIILDFEGPVRHILSRIASEADALCNRGSLSLTVGERYIDSTQFAAVSLSSGMVSGSLRQKLEHFTRQYGANRVILEVERLSQDIELPSAQGRGTTLSLTELNQLLLERRPAVFFSQELCAHYFTYKDKSGMTHFVLYDDASSVLRKLELARMLGLRGAVMLFSEIYDLLPELRMFI